MSETNGAAAMPRSDSAEKTKQPIPKADKYIWAIYILILVVSVVELFSASSREVQASNIYAPLLRHGRLLLVGVLLTVGISRMKYKWLIPLTPLFRHLRPDGGRVCVASTATSSTAPAGCHHHLLGVCSAAIGAA